MTDVSLPFSSQQQLLARLRHLSRLETDFIFLTGPAGSGKTHLANQLIEQTTLTRPVMLDAKALDSHTSFRDALLKHWFPGAIFDAQEPLADSMARLLPASLEKRLLVIDNGAWLTDIQLQELAQVYVTLPAQVRPFMLLLGTSQWAEEVRQQLDSVMLDQVLEIEVPPLTSADKEQLWQALNVQPPTDADQDIQYPGQVVNTMEPPMNVPVYRQILEQKSVKALLTVLVVIILLIVVVSFSSGPDKSSQLAQPQHDDLSALPTPIPNSNLPVLADVEQTADNGIKNGNELVQEWPTASLPETPSITATDTQTPDDTDKKRVVIEDDIVSELMQRESAPKPAPIKPKLAKPAPAKPVATQAASNQSAAPARANLGTIAELKQKPAQRYTLQLLAGRNKAALESLAKQHKLNPAWVYPRTINGQGWFVLVQGDYASADQAREAAKSLASDLQAAKPWPKPFGQVHKEVQP